MSRSCVFPYGITLRDGVELDVFPAAEVFFHYKEREELSLFLIIDSGAYISALPKSDADPLGVVLEKGDSITISGIGGKILNGWRHKIGVRIGDERISLPVAFLNDDSVPRVLGRLGLFDKFSIVFEESNKRTGFLYNASKEAKNISKILDKI